jgi:glycosyltransferase involved in cell wall biosynthesis
MNKRQKILIIAGAGIGGTEKCATIFALQLHSRGHVVGFISSAGPRLDVLQREGIRIFPSTTDPGVLAEAIRSFGATIIHQHVPGYAFDKTLYQSLGLLQDNKIKLIETNVFGRIEDQESWKRVDFRMFISSASAAQAFKRAGLEADEKMLQKHTVVNYPMLENKYNWDERESRAIRSELGVEDDEILFLRIGQPGHKWTLWEFEAFKLIKKKTPKARLLLMEPPEKLWNRIEADKDNHGVILKKVTNDFEWINKLNNAADISLHASAWGESFGYTIAEAMYYGKPVITRSTPWGDNAQVELVENTTTGFVCLSVGEMARRGIELTRNKKLRIKLGEAARRRIKMICDAERETDVLEAVIEFVLEGKSNQLLKSRGDRLKEFIKTFQNREYGISESLIVHPVEKTFSIMYLLYKILRGYIRNLKGRIRYSKF